MKIPLRCRILGHDYWPYQQPTGHGLMSEAACQCSRCGHTSVVQMWCTDQLFRRYREVHEAGKTPWRVIR
jgi:hypothetical protein